MKTKFKTGIVLSLVVASMLAIAPAGAAFNAVPSAIFVGQVTWAEGEEAWGKIFIRVRGDFWWACAGFYLKESKVFCKMKFVELDGLEIYEDYMFFEGKVDYYMNGVFLGTYGFWMDIEPEKFELFEDIRVEGSTLRYKTWGLEIPD